MRCLLHLKGAAMNSSQVHETNEERECERDSDREWEEAEKEIASVLCVHCMCAHLKCIQSRLDRLDMTQMIYVFARQHYKMPQSIFAPHTLTHTQREQRVCLLSHLIIHSLSLRYTHTHIHAETTQLKKCCLHCGANRKLFKNQMSSALAGKKQL